MSKEIIKKRAAEEKAALDLQVLRQRFDTSAEPSAKDCRQVAEAAGAVSVDQMVELGWTRVVAAIKDAASSGGSSVQIPAGPNNHPEVKIAIVKKLERAGFRHELVGTLGYIYW